MMKPFLTTCIGMLLVMAGISPPSLAGTVHPDLRAEIARQPPGGKIRVVVTLRDQLQLKQFATGDRKSRRSAINRALREKAAAAQKPVLKFLRSRNVNDITPFWIFNGMAVTLAPDLVAELAGRPDVESVRPDRNHFLHSFLSPAASAAAEWNLAAIGAPALWDIGYLGSGVVVAGMDTGVDVLHPDLAARWRGSGNSWYDPHGRYPTPHDSDGHGTQTMGVMVGGDAGGTSIGVAPGAQWIAVRIFDDAGTTSDSIIHQAFQWLLDPDGNPATDDLPDVVNGSWGFDIFVDQCYAEFQPDIQALKTAGVAVVFSAGNSGPGASTSVSPANYPESFAVGSVDEMLTAAQASSRGPSACDGSVYPEVVAPGVNILTADLTLGGVFPDSYAVLSGTSLAAPHVAGLMALLLSVDPQLTVDELEALLLQTARDLGAPGEENDYGYGLPDATAAYDRFTIHPFDVSLTGRGIGSVMSDPPGITCPQDCQGEYVEGRVVTLTAEAGMNSIFAGWSGDCSGTASTCQVSVDQAKQISASFYSFPWQWFLPILSRAHEPEKIRHGKSGPSLPAGEQ